MSKKIKLSLKTMFKMPDTDPDGDPIENITGLQIINEVLILSTASKVYWLVPEEEPGIDEAKRIIKT